MIIATTTTTISSSSSSSSNNNNNNRNRMPNKYLCGKVMRILNCEPWNNVQWYRVYLVFWRAREEFSQFMQKTGRPRLLNKL